MNSASVGGMVATAAVGTFSGRYGKMDDLLVGLEAVLPSGQILNTRAIPRRSVGPNLNHLFLGSEGTLGIVTGATLKIWPQPETRRWMTYTFPSTALGLEAVRHMMRTDAQAALVRLYDEAESADRLARLGYPAGQALLILGFEGAAALVEWQMSVVDDVCRAQQGTPRGEEAALDWYLRRFDTSAMLRVMHKPGGVADAIEVAAAWENLEGVWRAMRAALEPWAREVHCHFSHIYHAGGSVYVIFYAEAAEGTPQAAIDLYDRCLDAALGACLDAGGSISHHHGVGRSKSRWMEAEHGRVNYELMRALKRAIDPDNVLNPGALGIEAA
jgi:alkyldihydroxyacetonephosphate synthase